jgi:hypothetical protein
MADGGVVEHFLWVRWVGAVRTKNRASREAFYPPLKMFWGESQCPYIGKLIAHPVIIGGVVERA